jgi:hypothetical protein
MLHMDLDPHPGNNQSRLAVEDVRTGLVGTIDATPPLSLKGKGPLHAGVIIVFSSVIPVRRRELFISSTAF